jgi:hypothetical protein
MRIVMRARAESGMRSTRRHRRVCRWRLRAGVVGVATAALMAATLVVPSSVGAFGSLDGPLGQRAEHERITRIALGCAPGVPSTGDCFEPVTLDQLAGKQGTLGAVGAPDADAVARDPRPHFDETDFLDVDGYPRSEAEAIAARQATIDFLREQHSNAVEAAADLLDGDGTVQLHEVVLIPECTFVGGLPGRAKCNVLQALGFVFHGTQDIYSHSNWTDEADPAQPISVQNPPGLNLPGPIPLLDLRGTGPVTFPKEFTGVFGDNAHAFGPDPCPGPSGRVVHACLSKDEADIQPGPGLEANGVLVAGLGSVTDPLTPRGQVLDNVVAAVGGAVLETRRQWADFRTSLVERYGPERAATIVGALTKDTALDGRADDIPGVREIPGVPELPNVPGIPNLPGLPGIPGR